jgi:serine protease Do
MKQVKKYLTALALTGLLMPTFALAQQEKKENKEVEQIIITRKGNSDQKVNIEINGDKVTVNGKAADQLKDNDVSVKVRKFKEMEALSGMDHFNFNNDDRWNFNDGNNVFMYNVDENRAMLGVATENNDKGAAVKEVSKESAAEKAGLKVGDVITKVDDTKIVAPDDLTKAIQTHKPGDKVTITFLRDQKEQQVTTELTKWKGVPMQTQNFDLKIPQFNFKSFQDKNDLYGKLWNDYDNRPKLGMSVQDTEDGKGVKVIDVDDEGNAQKAGIKEGDLITSINGKDVNSADEVAKIVKENRDKNSVSIKLKRNGKTQDIEVKIPRKLKTADL